VGQSGADRFPVSIRAGRRDIYRGLPSNQPLSDRFLKVVPARREGLQGARRLPIYRHERSGAKRRSGRRHREGAMVRFILRTVSLIALVIAVMAGTIDAIQSVSAAEPVLTPLAVAWSTASPETIAAISILMPGIRLPCGFFRSPPLPCCSSFRCSSG
jgi:hypothetical protein